MWQFKKKNKNKNNNRLYNRLFYTWIYFSHTTAPSILFSNKGNVAQKKWHRFYLHSI